MQTVSFIRSLMEFNKRVLYQGTMHPGSSYSMTDLKQKLFFNKVFLSNTREMFQKYNTMPIISDYIESLGTYIRNISMIIRHITTLKPRICIRTDDSFEKRLMAEKIIADQVMTRFFPFNQNINYRFINGEIYYISLLANGYLAISLVDPRRSVYHEDIGYEFPKHTIYWKSDDCIKEYIRMTYKTIDTIPVVVTTSSKDPTLITKVEYNGDTSFIESIKSIFPSTALIISNPFIYTDDVDRIITSNIDVIPAVPKPKFESINIDSLLQKDMLIEYPNDSFDEYLQFLEIVSKDRNVKMLSMTLYRIGDDPSIFYLLRDAVRTGICVHVNIELCASGERINKMWARELEAVGARVTFYESGHLKVHSKLTLVKYFNGKSIAQIGTGNYHVKTTTQYTDFSLITSNRDICSQVEKVFCLLNGEENLNFTKDLLVTRFNARKELINLINRESDNGDDGCIIIKCNALDDEEISYHLDVAAYNGCRIELIIRGVCTWIPDQLGENVRVKSVVWDKLEHSRIYCFGIKNPTIYLGSLDLVTKKIDHRIETMVRVIDPDIQIKICKYLNRYVTSIEGSWLQTSSGLYIKE